MHSFTRKPLFFICLALSLFLSACGSVSKIVGSRFNYDHAQNFEIMQSYNFKPLPQSLENNKNIQFIREAGAQLALENAFAAKQIRKERYIKPDFWVNYYYTGEQGITVGQLNNLYTYNLGLAWDDKYGTGEGIANTAYRYSSHTFIIDMVSKENNQLVWRGFVPTGIRFDDTYDQKRKKLNKAAEVILEPFPPENSFSSLQGQDIPD